MAIVDSNQLFTDIGGDIDTSGYSAVGGLRATGALVFGFSANESGTNGSVSITQLDIELERPDGNSQLFTLGQDSITIADFNGGNSTVEAQLQLDLGFDFMQEYRSTSNRDLIISAQLSGNTGGQDRLFLSSAFIANPLVTPSFQPQSLVPLPASSWLFISSLAALICHKRRVKHA